MAGTWMADQLRDAFLGEGGAAGRVVLSSGLAGGIAAGGILMAAMAVAGRTNPGFQLLVAPIVFLLGTTVGLLHGVILALIGRPSGTPVATAGKRAAIGALGLVVLLPVAWLVSSAITVGAALVVEVKLAWALVAAGGVATGLVVCCWGLAETLALSRATLSRVLHRPSPDATSVGPR